MQHSTKPSYRVPETRTPKLNHCHDFKLNGSIDNIRRPHKKQNKACSIPRTEIQDKGSATINTRMPINHRVSNVYLNKQKIRPIEGSKEPIKAAVSRLKMA